MPAGGIDPSTWKQTPRPARSTQGDLTPNNAVLVEDVVHLVDFEGAGVRHLGMDAACLRLPFGQYGQWAALPDSLLLATDQAYRDELTGVGDTEYEEPRTFPVFS